MLWGPGKAFSTVLAHKAQPLQEGGKGRHSTLATHSSTLAWKSPWTEEPGRLQSMGSQRAGPPHTHTHTRARARAHVAYLGRLLSGASHTSLLLSPASLTRPAQLVWGVSLSPGARQGTGAQEGTQLGTLLWGHEGRRPQPLPRYSRGGSRRPRSLPRTNDRSSLPWLDCRWRSGIGSTIKTRQAWCTGCPTSCCP